MFVRHGLLSVSVALGLSLGAVACSKSESGGAPEADKPAASAAAPASASAAVSATATAPAANANVEETDAGNAVAAAPTTKEATKDAGKAQPAASGSAEVANCGTKPQPDCPLQAWMKVNTNPAIASNDLPALATALDKIATFAPPGYTNWASISKDGAKAARDGDMSAAKASCRGCHDQYKQKYKTEMRGRKI
ncbi:hypothetical protein AKJ09_01108 [Labilithrix luteola]|uniref:Cytochrome c domain-containing protein n=1 Tax=Labilithrix luteola TaxID=1391654 RepID=A0A0K1PMV2_9BACT|nr:hypothetical protein [Labilithrix luteola]AKU94444.1 hypothetical protein AKJ09_01108 [Labilithrix luteola]